MLCIPFLRKKFQATTIFIGGLATTMVGYALLFTFGSLHITNIVVLCATAVVIFIGFGLLTVLTTIFLADTVDYGEYKNGQRNESVIFSLQTFVVKLASAISGLIVGIGLDLFQFSEDKQVQAASSLFGLRFLMTVVPMIGLFITILFFKKCYKLNQKKLVEISLSLSKQE